MMQCPGCVEIRTGMYGEIMSLQSDIHEKVVENPSMEPICNRNSTSLSDAVPWVCVNKDWHVW